MNIKGLTDKEVVVNRKKYGSNELKKEKHNTLLKLFLESLGDPIIKILLIALGIKIIFLFQDFDWFETIGIVVAILIASLVSSVSEYGSEKAFARLQNESSKVKTKVKRNNAVMEIMLDEVVKGDIIILGAGDMIPADGYLIEGNITVDESMLNGEAKEKNKISLRNLFEIPKEENKLYRGTVVYSKEGLMLVNEVGEKTIYGMLAKELQSKEPESPLKLKLRGLAKIISKIGYVGAILVSISYLFSMIVINNNFDLNLMLETVTNYRLMLGYILYALTLSVTIIVVAVPEGLPMMITLVLSTNMKKMLKDNVLVRKLVGIETAGSINVLLTDKTGTLTKGKLEVIDFISGDLTHYKTIDSLKPNKKLYELVEKSILYNNASVYNDKHIAIGGNITDRALLNYINSNFDSKIIKTNTIPFDSNIKYSLTEINNDLVLIKGASEKILPYCNSYYDNFGRKIAIPDKKDILSLIDKYTKQGIRVLILAIKDKDIRNDYFKNLILVGIILIKDEIRKETFEGIRLVDSAHIQTIMITGDAKETAIAIGKEINLIKNDNDLILTSDELNKISDLELKNIYSKIKIVARALPSDKSRLVTIGQELNLVVGMTGDGVNDAPALKKANVGFAMGSGTEVSKEAADIVILDDNFLSISKAILFGRTIFKSIRKFIIFQLTVNMCALGVSIIGPFIGINTPITIVQMLWLNMIMDTLAGIAFSSEAPLLEYMNEYPKTKDESIINKYMYSEILFTGFFSSLLCILFLKLPFFKNLIRYDVDYKYLMTAYFALFIFIDIFNAFNARTERLNLFANIKKNKLFIFIISLIITVQIYLIYHGGETFRAYGLSLKELLIIILLSFTVIPIDILRKYYFKKRGLLKYI